MEKPIQAKPPPGPPIITQMAVWAMPDAWRASLASGPRLAAASHSTRPSAGAPFGDQPRVKLGPVRSGLVGRPVGLDGH
jgi:hypothetical protein